MFTENSAPLTKTMPPAPKNKPDYYKKSSSSTPPKQVITTPKNLTKISPNTPPSADNASTLTLDIGMTVEHQKFGLGQIEVLENGKATINFNRVGKKQLLLKFAKLKVLNN